ncbi:hypothetical protein K1719_020096 [Acacia pycnantha]|nr:hypothetical protein K1719_020096 [Acacia pycnantha]
MPFFKQIPCQVSLALMLPSYVESRPIGVNDYYQNNITSQGFELSRESRAQADLKYTYVVSCQIYGQQKQRKAPEAADISLLLQSFIFGRVGKLSNEGQITVKDVENFSKRRARTIKQRVKNGQSRLRLKK